MTYIDFYSFINFGDFVLTVIFFNIRGLKVQINHITMKKNSGRRIILKENLILKFLKIFIHKLVQKQSKKKALRR